MIDVSIAAIGMGVARAWVATYAMTALVAVARSGSRRSYDALVTPDEDLRRLAVLVRPLRGDEPGLEDRLAQTGGVDYAIFAVGDPSDTAAPAARRAAARLRERGIEASVIVTGASAPNDKADQLARVLDLPRARARGLVVVADSDVELGDEAALMLLRSLGGAHAVWAPPVERGRIVQWGDRISQAVLDASLHSFPLLAGIDGGGFVGKLFAVRRHALDAAGGFTKLTRSLGEDTELARRLRDAGCTLRVAPFVAHAVAEDRSVEHVVARFTRWLQVVRFQRPHLLLSYPLLIAAAPLLLFVLLLGVGLHERAFVDVAAAGLAVRMGIACSARVRAGLPVAPHRGLLDAFVGDVMLLVALAAACSTREITWRGRSLLMTREGLAPSGRKHAHEQPFGGPAQPILPPVHDGREVARGLYVRAATGMGGERIVDAPELPLDAAPLGRDTTVDVALDLERFTERNPEVRALISAERVTQAYRHDGGALGHARDERSAGAQVEGPERRTLPTLGKDPERAARTIEDLRGMADTAGAVGGVFEVDSERAHATEERHTSEVRRIHHRVPVTREEELGRVERDEGVPPRRVIRDEENGLRGGRHTRPLEPAHEDPTESAANPRARVPGEPVVEPAALRCSDHEVTS